MSFGVTCFFFKFALVVIFTMYSIIYTNDTWYYTNMRFHTFLLCNIFSVSTVTIQRIFFRILRGASCLRTNLLDIFFDQVRVRRSRPLTSSAIFCESAQVVKMDEDTKKRPFDCMSFFSGGFLWDMEDFCVCLYQWVFSDTVFLWLKKLAVLRRFRVGFCIWHGEKNSENW